MRRTQVIVGAAAIVCAVGLGEGIARFHYGYGTPPLVVAHRSIEYMLKPNQDIYRFHNHIIVNQYGMRSRPFPVRKGKGEFRIMVFGDSVLNGGSETPHVALSTSLLESRLRGVRRESVIVGNISAGSWGPGNWLAYLREYGAFDADMIVLLISSHDYADNPTFEDLNERAFPTRTPISALAEALAINVVPYLLGIVGGNVDAGKQGAIGEPTQADVEKGLSDLEAFLRAAQSTAQTVLVLQHWEKSEIDGGKARVGAQKIRQVCDSLGVPAVSMRPYLVRQMRSGDAPYRDNIHLNSLGQRLIADAIFEHLPREALEPSW